VPGRPRGPDTLAALPRHERVLISTCLVVISALAWLYLVHLARQMSSSIEHDTMMARMGMSGMATDMSWTAADIFFAFAMWADMMVGMMTASAAPVLLLFAATRAGHAGRSLQGAPGARLAVAMFGLGYITVWVGFSACAALAQWALHQTAMLSPAIAASSPNLAGSILIGAGAYQWTPWKGACLRHCRHPLGFLMTNWRDGQLGALRMGASHGAYCLGCCWALMCVLFAVGVMNLVWVAALTGFVLLEKIGPAGTIVARVAGAAMALAGILLIAAKA
jgi:predicted metal-binding membrane protein